MEKTDSKLLQQTTDLVGARRERDRTFDRMSDPRLNDEDRQKAIDEFKTAADDYDKQLAALRKK